MNDLRSLRTKLKEDLRTSTGRNFLTFLVFLAISTIFWFVMALNDEVQKDFKLPLVLEDFPQDMTIVSGQVATVNVTIKEKGSSLAKFSWGSSPQLKVRYGAFTRPSDDNLLLTEAQLNSAVRGIFGSSATVVAIRPDSIHLTYTTNPGVPVRVMVDADISTAAGYETFGAPHLSADTVMLYSNLKKRHHIHRLSTIPISLSELKDTTTVDARLIVPEGMRAIPSSVKVTFPVEALVAKTKEVKIETVNVPAGTRLIPFPAVIDVRYLLPKSLYSSDAADLRAIVDYKKVIPGQNTLPVTLVGVPSFVRNAEPSTSSVEYLIEHD